MCLGVLSFLYVSCFLRQLHISRILSFDGGFSFALTCAFAAQTSAFNSTNKLIFTIKRERERDTREAATDSAIIKLSKEGKRDEEADDLRENDSVT